MMTDPQVPSIDPADEGDLAGSFKFIVGKMLDNVDDMLPARIVAYDRVKNRASIQPLIKILTTSNPVIGVQRAQVMSVPVMQIGGGGFVLNFNLKAGDLGWLKANDRDISIFLQSYSESAPNTLRKHSFSDAVFIPDVMRGWTIAGEDSENAVLQTLDGTVRIALWANKVKITAPTVEIDSPTTHLTGALNVDGAITSQSTITGTTDVIAGTISGKTHTHGGVQTGTGNTGAPQ